MSCARCGAALCGHADDIWRGDAAQRTPGGIALRADSVGGPNAWDAPQRVNAEPARSGTTANPMNDTPGRPPPGRPGDTTMARIGKYRRRRMA